MISSDTAVIGDDIGEKDRVFDIAICKLAAVDLRPANEGIFHELFFKETASDMAAKRACKASSEVLVCGSGMLQC